MDKIVTRHILIIHRVLLQAVKRSKRDQSVANEES